MQSSFLKVIGVLVLLVLFSFSPSRSLAATNLLSNPGAESGDTSGWTATAGLGIISGHDNGWGIGGTAQSGSYSFISSYAAAFPGDTSSFDVLSQEINLVDKNYPNDLMDREPEITVGVYVAGIDGGSGTDDPYRVKVELRDKNHVAIATYDTGNQVTNGSWAHIEHHFQDYGNGVRYIYFELSGRSSAWWDGNYGAAFDDSSVTIGEAKNKEADIDSWSAEIIEEGGKCPQKLKLTIEGKNFDDDAEVSIGDHNASSVNVLSEKKLTAKFCLEKLSHKELLKKSISVKNPDVKAKKASKKIDLSLVTLLNSPATSFDQDTNEGVINIQKILVSLKFLSSEDVIGIYGPKTVTAVKAFQAQQGIQQTGNVGPKTIQAFQQSLYK